MHQSLLARVPRQSSQTAGAAGDKSARQPGRPPAPRGTTVSPWPQKVPDLIKRWNDGEPSKSIADRYGITKNALVGKVGRLREAGYDLEKRGSPIKLSTRVPATINAPAKPKVEPPVTRTAPPEAIRPVLTPPASLTTAESPDLRNLANPPSAAGATPHPQPYAEPQPIRSTRTVECCWPLGEPGTKPFRFCDEPALRNRPYCEEHAGLAYQTAKWKQPQQEEAA